MSNRDSTTESTVRTNGRKAPGPDLLAAQALGEALPAEPEHCRETYLDLTRDTTPPGNFTLRSYELRRLNLARSFMTGVVTLLHGSLLAEDMCCPENPEVPAPMSSYERGALLDGMELVIDYIGDILSDAEARGVTS